MVCVISTLNFVTVLLDTLGPHVMMVYFCICFMQRRKCNISDIIECDFNNGGCEQTCINFIGGHNCSCQDGFLALDELSKTCKGIHIPVLSLLCAYIL